MSEEPGVVNVEDDGPAIVADEQATPVAVAEVPDPAAPVVTEEDDPTTVDLKDIPKVGGLLGELKQTRQLNKQLKERAAKADQLETYVNDVRPYVDFLKQNPDLLKPRQAPAAPQQPEGEQVDPRATVMAQTLDLYLPDGKPDVARASVVLKMNDESVARQIQQAVGPVHERGYQEASAYNYQVALTIKDAQGRSPSPEALTQIWKTMSAQQTADPNVASILALTALGLDSVKRKAGPAAPGKAPIVTEGTGGGPGRASLSALEQSVARDRGVKESEWADRTKGFVSGRAHQLED